MSAAPDLRLGIDCATSYLAIAVVSPTAGVLASAAEDVGRAHAAQLLDALTNLLAGAGVAKHDIGMIGVGVGPGSYTGVRVAVASATGLSSALGVPLAGVSSLVALAGYHADMGEEIVAVSDARRGNCYAQRLRRSPTPEWLAHYQELDEPRKLAREALAVTYPGLRQIEGVAPDAAAVAWAATPGREVSPYYL